MTEGVPFKKMTDKKRQEIADLWQLGLSGSVIAEKLGITRNSVIGAVYRMRKNGIELSAHENKGGKPKKKAQPAVVKKIYEMPKESINILELKYYSCRFIVTHEGAHETLYCGKRINKESYCKDHYKICYYPLGNHGRKASA